MLFLKAEYQQFKIQVFEEDVILKNEVMLEETVNLSIKDKFSNTFDLNSSNNKVHLKILASVEIYPGDHVQANNKFPIQDIARILKNSEQKVISINLNHNSNPVQAKSKAAPKHKKGNRFMLNIYLLQFYVSACNSGEFYFKIDDQRYPNKGSIKLKPKDYFIPGANTNIFSAILSHTIMSSYQLNFKVKEVDSHKRKGNDLLMQKLHIEWKKFIEETVELSSNNIHAQIQIILEEVENW